MKVRLVKRQAKSGTHYVVQGLSSMHTKWCHARELKKYATTNGDQAVEAFLRFAELQGHDVVSVLGLGVTELEAVL